MKKYLPILLIFIVSCNSYKGKIKYVEDGDSYYLNNGREVRIFGADCPEWTKGHNQPFGDIATQFTRNLIQGKTVKLIIKDNDKYNREVDKLILANGDDLSLLLIKAGLAWTSRRYSPKEYCNEEYKAKINRVGLWAQDNPENPYFFRKRENKKY